MKPHKHAKEIKAWADGAEIQIYADYLYKWKDVAAPSWRRDRKYRVKPKVKWIPEYTLVSSEYLGNNPSHSDYNDISADVRNYWKLIKFVEEFDLDEDNQNYEVFKDFNENYKVITCDTYPSLGTMRMSEQCAEKLCDMLNNGEIEL